MSERAAALTYGGAILMDGGFVTKKLKGRLGRFPKPADVVELLRTIMLKDGVAGTSLYRAFFYDCSPFEGGLTNPIDGSVTKYQATSQANAYRSLLDSLELERNFAVRRGFLLAHGWQLGKRALKSVSSKPRPIEAHDLVPHFEQKGVDIRIGLDIALLSLRRIVDHVVLVSGDSDLVAAMKFARREGIKVALEHLGHGVHRQMKVHADVVL